MIDKFIHMIRWKTQIRFFSISSSPIFLNAASILKITDTLTHFL